MKHGSLFSGIGGFDLAAEWMDWENVFHCEWNEFGQKVLKHYWPNAETFTDITKSDFTKYANRIDILTGGFPCQPFSQAGKRKGTEDSRYLWPDMLRVIREVRPRWVIGENVYGLVNWDEGLVFDTVCADLENEGFEVWPVVLPAAGVDAPHKRDRIWFVAYSNSSGITNEHSEFITNKQGFVSGQYSKDNVRKSESVRLERHGQYGISCKIKSEKTRSVGNSKTSSCGPVANSISLGGRSRINQREDAIYGNTCSEVDGYGKYFEGWPTQSPLCFRDDGFSARLDTKTLSFSGWRKESIKSAGNAIVPQVAFQIFKAIEQYENL